MDQVEGSGRQEQELKTGPAAVAGLDPYNALEWEIIRNRDDPRRLVPSLDVAGRSVLDIGCGSGQTLMAPEFSQAALRVGVDIDGDAVIRGRRAFGDVRFVVGRAEALPFPDATFDVVISRLALPYTDLPRAVAEARRVLVPSGRLWLALHSWRMERDRLAEALRERRVRALAGRGVVIAGSLVQHVTGRPWPMLARIARETFQTERGMRRMLADAGFGDIRIAVAHALVAEARVASEPSRR